MSDGYILKTLAGDAAYYRNLSIRLGAKPNDMRSKFDASLCRDGIKNEAEYQSEIDEMNELWESHDELEAEIERLQAELDQYKAAMKTTYLLNRFSEPQRLASMSDLIEVES